MRRLFIFVPVLLVACVLGLWLFAPERVQIMEQVWISIGRPDWKGRAIAVAIFSGVVFFLSVKLLKRGPI